MKTDETKPTGDLVAEMAAVVRRIAAMQQERRLSDTRLVDEYPDLGSTKTWKDRLLPETFSGLNLERWHRKLMRVAAVLDGGSPDEEYYADMPFAREMHARMLKLERQQSDRRILACLAANGTGKSLFARWAVNQSRSTRSIVRMHPWCRNKMVHICSTIARVLGDDGQYSSPATAGAAVIRLLDGQPRTLFIDQAHEGGVALMHVLRALVDETPSRFVYLAYDTAFRQVMTSSTDAMVEAQSFMGRCLKPVFDRYRSGTRTEDVGVYLQRSGGMSRAAADSLAVRLAPALQRHTNLRLLDDAIAAARSKTGDDNPPADDIRDMVFALSGLDPKTFGQADGEGA